MPPAMDIAKGGQKPPPESISGKNPPIVVIVVEVVILTPLYSLDCPVIDLLSKLRLFFAADFHFS